MAFCDYGIGTCEVISVRCLQLHDMFCVDIVISMDHLYCNTHVPAELL